MKQILKPNLSKKSFEINANWTHIKGIHGWRHYRISSLRKDNTSGEIEVMSICERGVRFWLSKNELNFGGEWSPGWI